MLLSNRYLRDSVSCIVPEEITLLPTHQPHTFPSPGSGRCRHFCPPCHRHKDRAAKCARLLTMWQSRFVFPSHRKIANFRKAALCFKDTKMPELFCQLCKHWTLGIETFPSCVAAPLRPVLCALLAWVAGLKEPIQSSLSWIQTLLSL